MKPTDIINLAGRLPAQAITSATNTPSVDMAQLRGVAAICVVGSVTNAPSFKLQSSADNTTFTDLPDKTINSIAANSEGVINIHAEELPAGHRYIRAVVNGSATVAVVFIGVDARGLPQPALSTTTVVN